MQPLVISYDNNPNENTALYIKTLESNGWDYRIIGNGDTWTGWITRIHAYRKFLDTLEDERIVILTDARDVVCVRGPKAFIKGFQSFGKNIVVSAELTCGGLIDVPDDYKNVQCKPLTNYWKYHNITDLPNRKFVNNGLVAGRVKALKELYDWVILNKFTDDQLGLGHYVNTFPERVALDIEADILHTSTFAVNAGILNIHIQKHDSPTLAEFYGRGAFFLHMPGNRNPGQGIIYGLVKQIVNMNIGCKILSSSYKYAEPEWDEKF